MAASCKNIKYKTKRNNKPVVRVKKSALSPKARYFSDDEATWDVPDPFFINGEAESEGDVISVTQPKNTTEELKEWLVKQRFLPHDLSNELLNVFLSGVGYDLEAAKQKLHDYFYWRQEPSPLFRNRDPLSPENVKIFEKLYVLPMPDTTQYGEKIILTGLRHQVTTYSPFEHSKALAMVLDLLIWEKDFGFGNFIVVLDGRGFQCPQLLEKKLHHHSSVTTLLLETVPGTLRSFYLLYPPPHVANVADNRNGLWITVVKSKQEMIRYLPADLLPLEFGGNLGHLGDLLAEESRFGHTINLNSGNDGNEVKPKKMFKDQWNQHFVESRDFFVHFEKKMVEDYRRRICHEEAVREGGKNYVSKMKLEADEWDYKTHYYEKMKNMEPLTHRGFGKLRLREEKKKSNESQMDFLKKRKKIIKDKEKGKSTFNPIDSDQGYAPEIQKINSNTERKEENKLGRLCFVCPTLEFKIFNSFI